MKKKISIITLALLLCGTIIFTSCKKKDPPAAATTIELVSGGSQTGVVGNALDNPIVIVVKDQYGNAFAGAALTFSVTEGSVSPSSETSDASGNASVTWTLGNTSGSQTLTVSGAVTPLTINATAGALAASSIELVSGGSQSAMTEAALENPVVIVVKDQNGDPFAGTTVSFAVTEGSASVASAVADASGNASVTWTLGDTEGTQTLTVTGAGTPLTVNATGTYRPVIGHYKFGGVIFYIDDTDEHGLVCTIYNQGDIAWGCQGTGITGADGIAIGDGSQNTLDIVAGCGTGTAAYVCANLELNDFSDWFLPSIGELILMEQNKTIINTTSVDNGGTTLAESYYWSSSESSDNQAKTRDFLVEDTFDANKSGLITVRAVRAF